MFINPVIYNTCEVITGQDQYKLQFVNQNNSNICIKISYDNYELLFFTGMRRLLGSRSYCMVKAENQLMRHLAARIKANGPLPVAEYMKEVLTNPVAVSWINNKYCYDPPSKKEGNIALHMSVSHP